MKYEDIKQTYSFVETEQGIFCGRLTANNDIVIKLENSIFRRDLDGALSKAKYIGDVLIPVNRIYFLTHNIHNEKTVHTIQTVLEEAGI